MTQFDFGDWRIARNCTSTDGGAWRGALVCAAGGGGAAAAGLGAARSFARRILVEPRLRGEIAWSLGGRLVDFACQLVQLKLLTNLLGKEGFAEYSLVLTALMLLTNVLIAPMVNAYLRYHRTAAAESAGRAAGRGLLRWMAVVTASVLVLSLPLTFVFQSLLDLGRWTTLAAGVFFFFERWRGLSMELFELLRERKAGVLFNLSWHAVVIGLLLTAVAHGSRTPAAVLLYASLVSAPIAFLGMRRLRGIILPAEGDRPSDLARMVRTFGAPYAILLVFQWVQTFADRFLLDALLDRETVGQYIAAYQVCGVPFMLFYTSLNWLVMPVAYERAGDGSDRGRLRLADRVMLSGLAVYVGGGVALLGVYVLWGRELVALLTNESYVLPTATLVLIALGRFLQGMALLVQMFFAVHQQMFNSLAFRVLGAGLAVPIVWWLIVRQGVHGAALGTLIASGVYMLILAMGPGGFLWLVRAGQPSGPSPASVALGGERDGD